MNVPFYPRPIRALYIYAVVIVALFVVTIFWYIVMYRIVGTVQAGANAIMEDLGTNSAYSDLTHMFFENLVQYFLILFLFGLALFIYVYSQKPKEMVYVT